MDNYKPKRVTLFAGHYGSGKTNIAVNFALKLKSDGYFVKIADLDIVNPYFRTKDSADELSKAEIPLISPNFANSNVDVPALPPDLYALTDDRRMRAVIDVGGDDRGALVLGRLAPSILEENDYEMLMVINCYRPLTRDAASTLEVMREIEAAGSIRFTALVNNSNLGVETTAQDVLASVRYANEVADMSGLPVVMTTADERLEDELKYKISNLFPLKLQKKIQ